MPQASLVPCAQTRVALEPMRLTEGNASVMWHEAQGHLLK